MDATRVALLREVLATTGWPETTSAFARDLSGASRGSGGLLLVGTPEQEPWHLAAHLDDESRWNDIPGLSPTLVRWAPPAEAPKHLAIGLERLEASRPGETLFVVAPDTPPAPLLERVSDVRRTGVNIFTLDGGDPDLEDLSHETLSVPPDEGLISFDAVQHLISASVAQPPPRGVRGFRTRLARLLGTISGPGTPE